MKSPTSILLACLLASVSCAGAASSQTIIPPPEPIGAGDVNLPTFLELARADLKARKTFLIAQNLPLTARGLEKAMRVLEEGKATTAGTNNAVATTEVREIARRPPALCREAGADDKAAQELALTGNSRPTP